MRRMVLKKCESNQKSSMMNGADSLSPDAVQRREVEITVYDKQIDEMRVFRCDMHLLETSMAYFAPIINQYLEDESYKAADPARNNSKKFYNVGYTGGESRNVGGTSKRNVLNSPLPIPLRVNCEMGIFSWLMEYVEGNQLPFTPENVVSIALSSNFLLMTQLAELPLQYIKEHLLEVMLSGVNMECLTGELLARLSGMLSDSDLASIFLEVFRQPAEEFPNRRFLTALLRHMVCDRFGEGRTSGLRWCRHCGVLFDDQELQCVMRGAKEAKPVLCPMLSENSIGSRGEVLKTHVASPHPIGLAIPSIYSSDEEVERWAWRVIGATYYFFCRCCHRHVLLIDTVTHKCSGGMERFSRVGGSMCENSKALLAWYETAGNFYSCGLSPIYNNQSRVSHDCVLEVSPTGEWTYDDGSDHSIPGLWCTHPIAVEQSVDANGKVDLDAQNGFERWLVEELQLMMEEFGQMSQPDTALDMRKTNHADATASTITTGNNVFSPSLSSSCWPMSLLPQAPSSMLEGSMGSHFNGTSCSRLGFRGGREGTAGGNSIFRMRAMSGGNGAVNERRNVTATGGIQRVKTIKSTKNFADQQRTRSSLPVPNCFRGQMPQQSKLRNQNPGLLPGRRTTGVPQTSQ